MTVRWWAKMMICREMRYPKGGRWQHFQGRADLSRHQVVKEVAEMVKNTADLRHPRLCEELHHDSFASSSGVRWS
jgi:hypothetical protein